MVWIQVSVARLLVTSCHLSLEFEAVEPTLCDGLPFYCLHGATTHACCASPEWWTKVQADLRDLEISDAGMVTSQIMRIYSLLYFATCNRQRIISKMRDATLKFLAGPHYPPNRQTNCNLTVQD